MSRCKEAPPKEEGAYEGTAFPISSFSFHLDYTGQGVKSRKRTYLNVSKTRNKFLSFCYLYKNVKNKTKLNELLFECNLTDILHLIGRKNNQTIKFEKNENGKIISKLSIKQ